MPTIRELQGDPATEKYLDEDQVGVSQTKLGFPNVRTCQAVTVMLSNGVMIGGHYTSAGTEKQMTEAIQNIMQRDYPGETIDKMFVAYNSKVKALDGGDVQQKATDFGFQGEVQFLDTDKMKNAKKDGTYVQVENNNGNFEIQYKRNTKMEYERGEKFEKSMKTPTVRAALAATATKMHSGESKTKSVRVN